MESRMGLNVSRRVVFRNLFEFLVLGGFLFPFNSFFRYNDLFSSVSFVLSVLHNFVSTLSVKYPMHVRAYFIVKTCTSYFDEI